MRLRHIAQAAGTIEASRFVEHDPCSRKGSWHTLFNNNHPIRLEIGMGKGRFLTTLAEQNPDINYLGIECADSVIYRAVQKQEELQLPNLILIRANADNVTDMFEEEEIDTIYLNFSDPWPKDRHAKRRLTSGNFLEKYDKILKKTGCIAFKTDNRELFDYSLVSMTQAGWKTSQVTYDLHNSEYAEGNVMTEYEARFSAQGNPICRAVFTRE